MPDQEVLINDFNLNAIANAIRRKNGLVRTYKPREMAPAIRAINADAPDSREYTVTVIQTPHQTIKVRQVLGGEKQYDQSFTVSEPYWKLQASIEADAGYVAGGLNYPDEVTIDRDITIKATPATEAVEPPATIHTLYVKGIHRDANDYDTGVYSNEECTNYYRNDSAINVRPRNVIYNFIDKNDGQVPYMFGGTFSADSKNFGNNFSRRHCPDATQIIHNLNLNGTTLLRNMITTAYWLESVDLSTLDMSTVETISTFVSGCPYLKTIGNISNWNTQSLKSIQNLLQSNEYIDSLDLSGWNTPRLQTVTNLFSGGRILDISNWDTTNISSFSAGISAKTKVGVLYPAYLIMDKEEVKFSGNYIFGNIANCKYLVPEDMVTSYKQHPNWASRASQIDSVTNYTINRGDGQIEVVPNW